ncbi:MAG: J domain-containing protein [Ktedonobacteraceae bacterium]
MIPNYYTLLGVTPRASTTEIKRAYRHLARQHHPDVSVQSADEQIKRVNEAYAVLRDAKRRALYDEQLRQAWLHAEAVRRERVRQQQAQREPQMTWMQGVFGFVRELKKGMHDD